MKNRHQQLKTPPYPRLTFAFLWQQTVLDGPETSGAINAARVEPTSLGERRKYSLVCLSLSLSLTRLAAS
jgi:hypothetical protein